MAGEIRIPNKLLTAALSQKVTKALRLLAAAKLDGHRSEIQPLLDRLGIHPKTGQRLIKKVVDNGWAGTDGVFLFPRSWSKLKTSKRGGLYLTSAPVDLKRFEALCFAKSLKSILSRKASPARSDRGRTSQKPDLPTTYLCRSMGIKERRFKTLKAEAQRYKYLAVTPQVTIIGRRPDYAQLRKNLHGPPVFVRGEHTVVPAISKIKVLI